MSIPPSTACARQPRPRWLRVSLRTLLVLVTVFAVWLGWYANRAWRQKRAVAAIVAQGGKVFYATEGPSTVSPLPPPYLARYLGIDFVDSVVHVDLLGSEFDDADLDLLNDLPRLKWLQLYQTKVTGSGFAAVRWLRELEDLSSNYTPLTDEAIAYFRESRLRKAYIENAEIGDRALEHLATCKDLETLFIANAPVTDRGVQQLSLLKRLNNVLLERTQITDRALLVFADHPALCELKLRHNSITDQGLEYLGRPPNLDYVDVNETRVTPAGCARLKARYDGRKHYINVEGPREPVGSGQ